MPYLARATDDDVWLKNFERDYPDTPEGREALRAVMRRPAVKPETQETERNAL